MSMTPTKHSDNPLSDLLTNAAEEMDLPPEMRSVLRGIYRRAETHLRDHLGENADWQVYPQGSVRLGTVVRPANKVDYDLDVVVRSSKTKDQLTQAELKGEVGGVIKSFAKAEASRDNPPTACGEGGRCWTINYKGVHVDWLPAIGDLDAQQDSGILLTDRKVTRWQFGDPKAYSDWFQQQQIMSEVMLRKSALAAAANVDVEDIPDDDVRTTLHRLAQVLKIHRNESFAKDPTFQPPSIIITHLAALSYGGGTLIDELAKAAGSLPTFMTKTQSGLWVLENPMQRKENFADRWTDEHQAEFLNWIGKLQRDLDDLDHLPAGMQHMVIRLGESFGVDTITKAATRFGQASTMAVAAGVAGVTTSGLITSNRSRPQTNVRPHDFHGGRAPQR